MPHAHRARFVPAGLACMLAASPLAGQPPAVPTPMTFGGWIDVYPDVQAVTDHPELFDSVSLGLYGMRKNGSLERSKRAPDREAFTAWAHAHGIRIYATLGCDKNDAPGCFQGKPLERCLREVVAVCATHGFDGIDVDIEEIPATARGPFTMFIVRLLGALKSMNPPRRLIVTVQAYDNAQDEAGSFLDYLALGRLADEIRVMHYNCPWGEPGPLMPRTVLASEVAFARSLIPADKYVAGLPWFGVDWNTADETSEDILARLTEKTDGIPGTNELVSRFGVVPEWREPEGELFFSYTLEGHRHEAWVAGPRTFDWMVDVVRAAGAAGVYAYQLEYADLGYLDVVRTKVGGRVR